jgi:hypothetical protein
MDFNLSSSQENGNGNGNGNENDNNYEIEVSSQGSLNSELSSIDLDTKQYNVKRVKHNINRPRINYGMYMGSLAFDIIWEDNSETREPIQNLIDKESESINEFVQDIIEDYKQIAIKYPRNNRCCIMCWHKVYNGAFMCSKHMLMYNFLCE